jgi:hypothetical protein
VCLFFLFNESERGSRLFKVLWAGPWNSEHLFYLNLGARRRLILLASRCNLPSTNVPLMFISYFGLLEDVRSVRQLNMYWIMLRQGLTLPSKYGLESFTGGASSGRWLASMSQRGMTLQCLHISAPSLRGCTNQIQLHGRLLSLSWRRGRPS